MFEAQQIIAERYQLQKKLGDCSIRQTWLAIELATDSLVIIKLLAFGDRTQWQDLKLFEREAQILQQLNYPFIPEYYDYFMLESPGTWFVLVEQYIPGISLQLILDKGKTFIEAEVKVIAKKLLSILEYLHQLNPTVLHRDIKPSNIILGDDEEIYLVDFGSIQNQLTAEGKSFTIVGTYGYTPLEQFGGRAVPASDLYALGVTLIHLLTGIPPAELPQKDLQIQLSDCLVEQKHRLKISGHFAQWLTKITHPAVEYRFSNVAQARRAIDSSLPELPFVTRKRTKKSSKSKLILGLIILGAITYTIQLVNDKFQIKLELSKIEHCQKAQMARTKILELDPIGAIPNYCRDKSDVIKRWNKEKKSLVGLDLSRINLDFIDLKEANMERVNLYQTDLNQADLQNANLSYANLERADLKNANLQDANLNRVILDRAVFVLANLRGASIETDGKSIEGTNFYAARLEDADFEFGSIYKVNFSHAYLRSASLGGHPIFSRVSNSNFERADLHGAFLYGEFIGNNFQYANLSEVILRGHFKSNYIKGVDFYQADLKDAVFDSIDFDEVSLTRANLRNATIINSSFTPHQIKSACNWEQAYYINTNVDPSQIDRILKSYKTRDTAEWHQNQQYIEQLKQDRASDPKDPIIDCGRWFIGGSEDGN